MIFTLKSKAYLERWTRGYEKNNSVLLIYLFKAVLFLVTLWYGNVYKVNIIYKMKI